MVVSDRIESCESQLSFYNNTVRVWELCVWIRIVLRKNMWVFRKKITYPNSNPISMVKEQKLLNGYIEKSVTTK